MACEFKLKKKKKKVFSFCLCSNATGPPLAVVFRSQPRPGLDSKLMLDTTSKGRHGSAGLIYIYVDIYVHTVSTVRVGRASWHRKGAGV